MMEEVCNVVTSAFGWNDRSALHSLHGPSLFSLCDAVLQQSAVVWELLLLWHPQRVTGSVAGGREGQAAAYRQYWSVFIDPLTWSTSQLSSEPDLSQCNGGQRVSGVCPGPGDDPAAVQPPFCRPFMGVSCHTQTPPVRKSLWCVFYTFTRSSHQECSGDAHVWLPHWQIGKPL